MGRKQQVIQTRSYIPLMLGSKEAICLEDLSNSQRDYLGALLQSTSLNACYAGRVRFWAEDAPAITDVFPHLSE